MSSGNCNEVNENLVSESKWINNVRLCRIGVVPITQLRICVIQGRSPNMAKVISMP